MVRGGPGTVQKVVASRMHFPSCGHTGHTAHIVIIKSNDPLPKSRKIRRNCPITAVVRQHVTVQGVVHDHDCFHAYSPSALNEAALVTSFCQASNAASIS